MPGFSIGGNSNEPSAKAEIYRSHRWEIKKLGPIKKLDVIVYAKSLKLPGITFEVEPVAGGSLIYKFAKTISFDDIIIEFYDVAGLYQELLNWQQKVWTPEDGLRPAQEYMDTCEFSVRAESTEHMITCHNCWPKNLEHSPLSYEKSELKTVSITLACSHTDTTESRH